MDEDQQPRMNRVQDLLKVAIEYQAQGESSVNQNEPRLGPLDPERRRFLEDALMANTVNPTDILKEAIQKLKQSLEFYNENNSFNDETQENTLETLDSLIQWVGQIDFARDFITLGGYHILLELLNTNNNEVIIGVFDVLAEILQNNELTQKQLLEKGLLQVLISQLQNEEQPASVATKAIYCLSSFLRGNRSVLDKFIEQDGLGVLVKLLQTSNNDRLATKTSFLLSCLCSEFNHLLDLLFERGFADMLVSLLHRPTIGQSHEFLLSLLFCACQVKPVFVNECRRPEINLKNVLDAKIVEFTGKEEYLEAFQLAHSLRSLLFGSNTFTPSESER